MSTGSTGTGESHRLDQKIKEIKEVLARDISNDDRQSLKRMLMDTMDEKKRFLESHLKELKAKYGLAEDKSDDVIVVSQTPSPRPSRKTSPVVRPSASMKGPPGKYTKQAMGSLKKRKRTEEQDDPDFEISPPPAKKKLSLRRKPTVITLEASDDSQEEESESPAPKKGKGKAKAKSVPKTSTRRANLTPETSADDSDSPAPTSKKGRRRATPRKPTPAKTGRRRAVAWCSSSSDEGGHSGIPYTLDELNAMYDTMEAEDP